MHNRKLAILLGAWAALPAQAGASWRPYPPQPICVEVSDIVGHRRCSPFGRWDDANRPRLTVEAGLLLATVSSSIRGRDDPTTDANVAAFALRVTGRLAGVAYLGGEAQLGVTSARDPTALPPLASSKQLVHVAIGVPLGLAWPLGMLTLRTEIVGGIRALALDVRDCESCRPHDDWLAIRPSLVPRAGLELWLAPTLTLGATAGADVADGLRPVFALTFGWHARSFDAVRRL
jgi:hypothetical protein